MAITSIPTAGGGDYAEVAAEVVADFQAEGFDAAASASEVTIVAATTEGGIGTAVYEVLTAARDGLAAAGVKTPKGKTLRSKRVKTTGSDADGYTVVARFYFGKPTRFTKPANVGK